MSLFKKSENTQAYLKAGLMGFAGSGKTFTASLMAIGLIELMRERGIPAGNNPAMFIDTETGSDWVKPQFDAHSIELFTAKTRAFADLITAVKEAEESGSVLIIDSVTHFWRELCDSYAEKRGRKRGLEFQDWAVLKKEWGRYTDLFVNSNAHIIMCGRAGYEYDFFENENGKKELEKTGIKMRAEGETGFEPSLLVLMERHMDMESKESYRTATIVKDRSTLLDGRVFKNPNFEHFRGHVDFLNLGGQQFGVDVERNSKGLFNTEGKTDWQKEKEEKAIVLDEIQSLLVKHYPSTSGEHKAQKIKLLEKHFQAKSWMRVETYPLAKLRECYDKLHLELEGIGAYEQIPDATNIDNDQEAGLDKAVGAN